MVSIGNSLSSRYTNKLQNNSRQFNILMDGAKSGIKRNNDTVSTIFSKRLSGSVEINRSVLRNISTGQAITSLGKRTLDNVADGLRSLQLLVQSSSIADNASLQIMQKDYINQVGDIINILEHTKFNDMKLFDGSFANRDGARDSEAIPVSAKPLSISMDENINNNFLISIPRLLAGDGSATDIEAPDRFMPLFPWNPASLTSIKNITQIMDDAAGGSEATDDTEGPAIMAAEDTLGILRGTLINRSSEVGPLYNAPVVEYMISAIETAIPEGANEYNRAIYATVIEVLKLGPIIGNEGPQLMCNTIINIAKAAVINSTPDTEAIIDMIKNEMTAAIGTGGNPYANIHNTLDQLVIPTNVEPAIKAIYGIMKSIVKAFIIPKFPTVMQLHDGCIAAAKAATRANPGLAAGDILTPENRETAKKLIEQALTKVTMVSASLDGAQKIFTQATDNLKILNIQSSDAANNLSEINYVKNNAEILTIMRSNKVAGIAFRMSEDALNKIIANLTAAAA